MASGCDNTLWWYNLYVLVISVFISLLCAGYGKKKRVFEIVTKASEIVWNGCTKRYHFFLVPMNGETCGKFCMWRKHDLKQYSNSNNIRVFHKQITEHGFSHSLTTVCLALPGKIASSYSIYQWSVSYWARRYIVESYPTLLAKTSLTVQNMNTSDLTTKYARSQLWFGSKEVCILANRARESRSLSHYQNSVSGSQI